jgi:predicted aspartyl protease
MRALHTQVGIFSPVTQEEAERSKLQMVQGTALWDTGATNTVITKSVADGLGIKPIGKATVHHANGESETDVYLVNIGLPNTVVIPGVRVTEGKLTGADVLIGMDIISLGDFAITHKNEHGGTTLSFCIPSVEEIDFVPRAQVDMVRRTGNRDARRALKKKRR